MVDVFAGILCENDSGEDEEKLKKALEHEDVSAAADERDGGAGLEKRKGDTMLLGCGCLLAMAAAFAPRVVLIFMWIFGWRISAAFESWIWPLLGIIFLPYTTIMYVLVWTPATGISGWDWLWIALGVMLDIMKWGQIANNRRGIPGYPETAY